MQDPFFVADMPGRDHQGFEHAVFGVDHCGGEEAWGAGGEFRAEDVPEEAFEGVGAGVGAGGLEVGVALKMVCKPRCLREEGR